MTLSDTKGIGTILFESGRLSQSQLKRGLEEKKKNKDRPLGQILVDLGFITQEQLSKAYLKSAGYKL